MRKTVIPMIIITLMVCAALPAIADDGLVLPAGIIRVTLVPSYDWLNGAYDTGGKYTEYSSGGGKITAFDTGAAIEYGVTNWITAAVQWTPGWNISSKMDVTTGTGSNVNVNGLYDAFIGAKFQILGDQAPFKNDTIRFCLAGGVTVPFGGPSMSDQYTNATQGKDVTIAPVDVQTLGIGGRLYFDYIFSKAFFLNLYSQIIYYPGTVPFKDTSLPAYEKYLLSGNTFNPDVGYGYNLTLEVEPHYIYALSSNASLEGSLPVTLTTTPNLTYGGTSQSDTYTSLLVVRPTLDLFLMKSPIPFPVELKVAYSVPLVGWNTGASNALILILRFYV